MRTACIVLLLLGLAYAGDEVRSLDAAKALLASTDLTERADGVAALAKLGTREALEALAPRLEDPEIGRQVAAAFVDAVDRDVARAVLEGALLDPRIPVGPHWIFTRGALDHERVSSIGGGPFGTPWRVALTDEERARLLDRVAAALPVKRASALAPAFHVLVAFHHATDHLAPAAARAWTRLPEETRAYLLGDEGWPLIRGEVIAATLPRTPMADRAAYWHVDHARSLALRRLAEMGSRAARDEILADMALTAPRLTCDALLALEDEYLPDFEGIWAQAILDRQYRNLTKLAPLIERYASDRLLDDVLALYRESTGWACDIQAALLGYLLKHQRASGIALVREALGRRGETHTGCYRSVVFDVLPRYWSEEAEALALECLADAERDVRVSGARALIDAGSLGASHAVLALIRGLDSKDPLEGSLRFQLLVPLVEREAWMEDPDFRRSLFEQLEVEDRHVLRLPLE